MAFTAEDKTELATLIATAMDEERDRRRKRYQDEQKQQDAAVPALETKLYLISTGPHERIAFPDDRGRAILMDTFYARITTKNNQPHTAVGFWDIEGVTVIAFGDGKILEKPFRLVMSRVPFMVEIEPGFLETV